MSVDEDVENKEFGAKHVLLQISILKAIREHDTMAATSISTKQRGYARSGLYKLLD